MLHGFMGMEPRADGLKIHPNLPGEWPGLGVTRVDFRIRPVGEQISGLLMIQAVPGLFQQGFSIKKGRFFKGMWL